MSWFPLAKTLMEDSPEFRLLTPTEKLFFWCLVSEYNFRGGFYRSDLEMAIILKTTEKTIRRGRTKLIDHGFIQAQSGTRTRRNHYLATRYLGVQFADVSDIPEGVFFAQMHRHAFNAMLDKLRKETFHQAHIVIYIYLSYWYWKMRGVCNDNKEFDISKNVFQKLTNINNSPMLIRELYEGFTFSGGTHLFEYRDKYHRVVFSKWGLFADPEDDVQNLKNAERYTQEVSDLVKREKSERLIREEKKTALIAQKISDGDSPRRNLGGMFDDLYIRKYGRWPNTRGYEKLKKLWLTFGEQAINRAINYYFTAEEVPNGSGAKTRTLGNFIAHIDEILRLTHEAQPVKSFV